MFLEVFCMLIVFFATCHFISVWDEMATVLDTEKARRDDKEIDEIRARLNDLMLTHPERFKRHELAGYPNFLRSPPVNIWRDMLKEAECD